MDVRDDQPTVKVDAVRKGRALYVQVEGMAPGLPAASAFEKPDRWNVTAKLNGSPLDRILNGSTQVSRIETREPDRWDVTVRFQVAFRLPAGALVELPTMHVAAPGEPVGQFRISVLDDPEATTITQASSR